MNLLQSLLFFIVSFLASIAGAICGIGGGVIIKPVLDVFGWMSVSSISFLSGCTVLSMSCYSVGKSMINREKQIEIKTATPLAIGAALGGVVGKQMFTAIKQMFEDPNKVGAVQAICLLLITAGTMAYTLFKSKIKTHNVKNPVTCSIIGFVLGIFSSFLGIGGGPINLVVLFFFFSMETKTAAANSLYIILFSQLTSLISTLVTNTVPEFDFLVLALMVCGGIFGGIVGRKVNKHIESKTVDKLFIVLMGIIIIISVYNALKYSGIVRI